MPKKMEHEWSVELPAATAEQLLAALAARDLLFGQTITLEPEDEPKKAVEVWLGTSEELVEEKYFLGIYAELTGPGEYLEAARDALEDIVAEQLEAAASEAASATLVERRPLAEVQFSKVAEDEEIPQLIIPEWLAPADAELPWGFRGFTTPGGEWPPDEVLKRHERLALVPFHDEVLVYALPTLEEN
jgi:hypothetical protein